MGEDGSSLSLLDRCGSPKGFQVCKGSLRKLKYVFQLPTNNIEKEVIKINKRNGNLAMNTSPGGSSCSLFPD